MQCASDFCLGIGLSKLEPISGTTQTSIKKFFGKIDNIGLKHKATEQLAVCGSSHSLFEKNNIVEELDDPDEVDDKGGHCNPDELDVLSDDRFNLNLFNDKFGYNGHQVNTDSELVLDTTLLCPVCGRATEANDRAKLAISCVWNWSSVSNSYKKVCRNLLCGDSAR